MTPQAEATLERPSPSMPRYGPALALLATLFFMWGFITVINNTLLPHLRSVFQLNYTQTTLIESTWFIGYLVASIPAAKLIERIGYQRALVTGLAIMTVGSLGMIPAARLPSYEVTLVSLFVVSCGIAVLQVAANPYVAVIGPRRNVGIAPHPGAGVQHDGRRPCDRLRAASDPCANTAGTPLEWFISPAQRMADAEATQLPYLIVAIVLACSRWRSRSARLPELGAATRTVNAEERKRSRYGAIETSCSASARSSST